MSPGGEATSRTLTATVTAGLLGPVAVPGMSLLVLKNNVAQMSAFILLTLIKTF